MLVASTCQIIYLKNIKQNEKESATSASHKILLESDIVVEFHFLVMLRPGGSFFTFLLYYIFLFLEMALVTSTSSILFNYFSQLK